MTRERPPDQEKALAEALEAVRRYAANPDITPYLAAIAQGEAAASPDPAEMNMRLPGLVPCEASLILTLEASRIADASWIVHLADGSVWTQKRIAAETLATGARPDLPTAAFAAWQAQIDASRLQPVAEPRLHMDLERRGGQVWGEGSVSAPVRCPRRADRGR